jgi:hypothetical protein
MNALKMRIGIARSGCLLLTSGERPQVKKAPPQVPREPPHAARRPAVVEERSRAHEVQRVRPKNDHEERSR